MSKDKLILKEIERLADRISSAAWTLRMDPEEPAAGLMLAGVLDDYEDCE